MSAISQQRLNGIWGFQSVLSQFHDEPRISFEDGLFIPRALYDQLFSSWCLKLFFCLPSILLTSSQNKHEALVLKREEKVEMHYKMESLRLKGKTICFTFQYDELEMCRSFNTLVSDKPKWEWRRQQGLCLSNSLAVIGMLLPGFYCNVSIRTIKTWHM